MAKERLACLLFQVWLCPDRLDKPVAPRNTSLAWREISTVPRLLHGVEVESRLTGLSHVVLLEHWQPDEALDVSGGKHDASAVRPSRHGLLRGRLGPGQNHSHIILGRFEARFFAAGFSH